MRMLWIAASVLVLSSPALAQRDVCRPDSATASRYQPVNVQFDTGSTQIKPADQAKIAELAKIAKASKIQQICIKGFADKQGNAEANRKLSIARGEAVAAEFGKHGLSRDYFAVQSGGEPGGSLFGGVDAKSQADRRVEIRIAR